MKNLKNEKKPLYNEEKRTILTPSYFRGNRGSYEGSILSVFPSYITVFFEFLTVFHEYHILLTWLLLTLRICYPYIKLIYKLYENNSLILCSKFFDRTSTFWAMPLYIIDNFFVLTLFKKFWLLSHISLDSSVVEL